MKTPRELRARLKRIDANRPGVDPSEDARRTFVLIGSMAGLVGCGDPIEKKDDDGETKG